MRATQLGYRLAARFRLQAAQRQRRATRRSNHAPAAPGYRRGVYPPTTGTSGNQRNAALTSRNETLATPGGEPSSMSRWP